ncbi:MAG: TMEM165/GDT1 family protein [Candidatus Heimdallarchaeota archaeon]|nr:TMEM165/GDT1 family protein [Candidatus Heimdallarchaeota archaeon]
MDDFLGVLLSSTLLMALAEIGDKTNLILISLISRYKKPFAVFSGGIIGIIFITIIGAVLGSFLSTILPMWLVPLLSGMIFLYLGISSLLEQDDDDVQPEIPESSQAFKQALLLISFAEFGDKSQVFVISNSAINDPIAVAIGAILGMIIIFLLSGLLGATLLQKIPEKKLNGIASILFIIAGLWIIIDSIFAILSNSS